MIIKKYANRRLYDTRASRYITLDDLTALIRAGNDVRVVDAKSGADLTQATLTQIIIEGQGADRLLPVPLLLQLIRLGEDALAEFLGRHLSFALEMYLRARQQLQVPNPFAWMGMMAPPSIERPGDREDVEALRREVEELKRAMRKK